MLSQCYHIVWKVEKNTESWNPKFVKTKNERMMLSSKCGVCDSKKSRFIKEQEASGLLISLGIKTPLSKIPLVSPPFLRVQNEWNSKKKLLAGDKFMLDMHLRWPGFTCSACGSFAKKQSKKRIQKFKQIGFTIYLSKQTR